MSTHNLCFLSRNKKNNVYTCKLQFQEGYFLTSGNNPIKAWLACAYTCVIYHWKG